MPDGVMVIKDAIGRAGFTAARAGQLTSPLNISCPRAPTAGPGYRSV